MINNIHKLHVIVERHMEKIIEEIVEDDNQILVDFWYTTKLSEHMTQAVVNVISTADETQQWLRDQGMLEE